MTAVNIDDALIREVLQAAKTIAVLGFSANPARPSYVVSRFLQLHGFRIVPVNPGLAGQTHLGETVYASLAEVPFPVDIVDVFRQSDALPDIVDETIVANVPVLWTQLGVYHEAALNKALATGLRVISDRCPKIEIGRLGIICES